MGIDQVLVDKLYLSTEFLTKITKEQLVALHQTGRLAMKLGYFKESLLNCNAIA